MASNENIAKIKTTDGVVHDIEDIVARAGIDIINEALPNKANKATTLEGYGITDAADKVHTHSIEDITLDSDLVPTSDNTISIGTAEKRLAALYAEEVHIGSNTLYINDTPVLGSNDSDTVINIKADTDQSLNLQTKGVGAITANSEQNIDIRTKGTSNTITFVAEGASSTVSTSATGNITNTAGSHLINTATTQISETAPNINLTGSTNVSGGLTTDTLTVTGNLNVKGTQTILETETVTVKDNIIELNKGQTGSGVSAGQAGIKIDRGDASAYEMIFDETDDMFKMGAVGNLVTISSQEYVNGEISTLHTTVSGEITTAASTKVDKVSGKGLSTNDYTTEEKNKLASTAPISYLTQAQYDALSEDVQNNGTIYFVD